MQWKFPLIEEREKGDQAVNDLGRQLQKYIQRWNQKSINTRYRYAEACSRWVKFAGRGQPGQPGLQKIQNISDRHLEKYAQHLQSQGRSDKYIKNEMSALRYMHTNLPNARHELGDAKKINKEAGLGSTPNFKKGVEYANHAWTQGELDRFADHARSNVNSPNKLDNMMLSTREMGCRLEEIATLRRDQIESAFKTGKLHLVNTKGGRPRDVPLTDVSRRLFKEAIQDVSRGDYVYIPKNMPVHSYIKSVKDYIDNHRDKIQDPTRVGNPSRAELHYHGIRHQYAQEKYAELRNQGMTDREARLEVAQLLGHGRIDVTYVYIPR